MKTLSVPMGIAAFTVAVLLPANAHIGYTGRNFGTFTGLSYQSVTISNQAITGNYGWADAADGNLGDSHKARAYRFHLETESLVSLTFSANATATGTSVGGLLPGISVYQGLAAIAPLPASQTSLPSSPDHDGSEASIAWRDDWAQKNLGVTYDHTATDGSWNALGNWKIGGDGDLPGDFTQLTSFAYMGYSIDSDNDGTVSLTTILGPGDYTILAGGIDLSSKGGGTATLAFGVSGTLSVNTVPEPGTWALAFSGGAIVWFLIRRK